jgi:transcriptional regulator with XRE-family HTH domain
VECERTSQSKVAKRLGVSAAMVNQVLKGSYSGNLANIEGRVRGELMGLEVDCPALGKISRRDCLDFQNLPFAATSPVRIRLYRACRSGCPFSSLTDR